MTNKEPKEKKNLFIELAKRKAAAKASGKQFGILGKDLSDRFAKTETAQSYTRRGGRNSSGKP